MKSPTLIVLIDKARGRVQVMKLVELPPTIYLPGIVLDTGTQVWNTYYRKSIDNEEGLAVYIHG